MTNLNNQTAFITGASRGIGAATAHELAEHGANVVLAARTLKDIQTHADAINDKGGKDTSGKALAVACDVADYAQVQAAVQKAEAAFGPVTILVNNAGIIEPIARIDESDPEEWGKVIDINVKGVYHCAHAVLPGMKKAGGGTIINISSGAASGALEGWSQYCSSKAAVLSLTRCLHKEFADNGIRTLGLSPGTVATEMQVQIKASGINPVSQLDPSVHIPAEWVGKTIAWLCTAEADEYQGGDVSLREKSIRAAVGLVTP